MYTSRSAVEAFQDCPRYRFNQYFLGGKGVVRVQKSVPLVTGSAVHRGVEHLLNRVRIGETPDTDTAVLLAVNEYVENAGKAGFSGKALQTDKQQWFTFCEQKALVEGLIRSWAKIELPRLSERYKVLAVERDIEPLALTPGVLFQAKTDAEFQEKTSGDYVNYSLKTTSSWGERNEASYKSDLQGATEIWAVEEDNKRENGRIEEMITLTNDLYSGDKGKFAKLTSIVEFLKKKKVDKKVSAVRFCFLIKGVRKVPDFYANDADALAVTYSPLIRGYKNLTPGGVSYAHSWFYPNPNNKSGKSILGKGWEPFNVWENMGVKEWMEMLPALQPDCGDIIKHQVVTPIEYFRSEGDVKEAIEEAAGQESRIEEEIGYSTVKDPLRVVSLLNDTFPHNRKHCHFHFGGTCEYLPLCWQPEVGGDPIGSGLYQIREPHHEGERKQL